MDLKLEKKQRRMTIPIAGAVLALAAVGFFLWPTGIPTIERDAFRTARVERGTLPQVVRGRGKLIPAQTRLVSAPQPSTVQEIFVESGQTVENGQPLIRLQAQDGEEALIAAQNALDAVVRQYESLRIQNELALLTIEGKVQDSRMRTAEAESRLATYEELMERRLVSRIEFDEARTSAERSRSQLDFEVRQLSKTRELKEAELELLAQEKASLAAALDRAQENLQALTILAPVSGTVDQLEIKPGQFVGSSDVLARIIDTTQLIAQISVPDYLSSKVALGQQASATIGESAFTGEVIRVDPSLRDGNIQVDIAINDLPITQRPETVVEADIDVGTLEDALYIARPPSARENATGAVHLAQDGSLRRQPVKFGVATPTQVQIVDGLEEGDIVVISDLQDLADRDTIEVGS